MNKYIVRWNVGYGDDYAVIDAETIEDAVEVAYEEWRQEAESNADYSAEEYSEEKAELVGL